MNLKRQAHYRKIDYLRHVIRPARLKLAGHTTAVLPA